MTGDQSARRRAGPVIFYIFRLEENMTGKIKTFFELIKFEHTVFALPFAYLGLWMANKSWPSWSVFLGVTLAMVSARTAGMTLNRLADRAIDAKNPRTRKRALVTGEFSVSGAWIVVAASIAVFFSSRVLAQSALL